MQTIWRLIVRTGRRFHHHVFDGDHQHVFDSEHCRPPACIHCGSTGWPK